jgi:hypothetical protein
MDPISSPRATRPPRIVVGSLWTAGLIGALVAPLAGCVLLGLGRTDRQFDPPPPPRARLVEQLGGTHHVSLVHEGRWYTGLGATLLTMDARNGRLRRSTQLRAAGESGPIVDLLLQEGRLFVVLEDTAVVEVDLSDPDRPEVMRETAAESLGVLPRRISSAAGGVFVSGVGGVVDLLAPTAPRLAGVLESLSVEAAGPVVDTAEGPVSTVGRRIYRVLDDRYLGAASRLVPLPAGVGPEGGVAFVLQDRGAAEVGLMSAQLRVVAARTVPGQVWRIGVFDGHLWVVDDRAIVAYPIEGDALGEATLIPLRGGRDIVPVAENLYAVVGEFGRALYRWKHDRSGPADEFFAAVREPAGLRDAFHDGRRVTAGGDVGWWLFAGNRAESVDAPREERAPTPPRREVVATWGRATILEGDRAVEIEAGAFPVRQWSPTPAGRVHTLLAVGDSLWVGHQRGIDLLRFTPETGFGEIGSIRLEGPVRYLFPQRIGTEVNFVSERGGFGIVDDR